MVVDPPDGDPYRDFTLLFQDEDAGIGTHRMPYTTAVRAGRRQLRRAVPTVQRGEPSPPAAGPIRRPR